MLYIVKNNNKVILETYYASTIVFIDILSYYGLERTDDEIVKIAEFLNQAYFEAKQKLRFISYIEVVADMETKDILNMDMHKLIKKAIKIDSMLMDSMLK